MGISLANTFFARDARIVAKDLLGKYLVRRVNGKTLSYKIVETEAYVGPHDKASHAHRGRTARNDPMWGPPGRWYVYFTYGMHYMLNVVTGRDGYPAAVLIRGVKPVLDQFTRHPTSSKSVRHRMSSNSRNSLICANRRIVRLDGPGKLTKALRIDKKLNTKLASPASGLWIEDVLPAPNQSKQEGGEKANLRKIKRTARVGVAYAGEWAEKPLRYILED